MKEILSVSVVITKLVAAKLLAIAKFMLGVLIIMSIAIPTFMSVVVILNVIVTSIRGGNPFESQVVQILFINAFGIFWMFFHSVRATGESHFLFNWLNFIPNAKVRHQ